jgi:hypothetical protein
MSFSAMIASDSRIQPSRLLVYPAAVFAAVVADVVVAAEALVEPMSGRASTAAPVAATARVRARRVRRC